MCEQSNNSHSSFDLLKMIYDQQHYFIDRHETMADKILRGLVLVAGFVSISLALINKGIEHLPLQILTCVGFFIVLFIFGRTYLMLSSAVKPLSSSAKSPIQNNILDPQSKAWVRESMVYYRGVVKSAETDVEKKLEPASELIKRLSVVDLSEDLSQQIIILARYSDYKRKILEEATKWSWVAVSSGLVLVILCLVMRIFFASEAV